MVAGLDSHWTPMNLAASPKRAGKPPLQKDVSLCLVSGVHAVYKGENFVDAWTGLLLSAKQMTSRLQQDDDGAIRFLSGLIAKDPKNRPLWESELHQRLTKLGPYSYEPPNSQDNLTSCECELQLEHASELLTAPGAWVFQCMSTELSTLLLMLENTIAVTMLGAGLDVFILPSYYFLSVPVKIFRTTYTCSGNNKNNARRFEFLFFPSCFFPPYYFCA